MAKGGEVLEPSESPWNFWTLLKPPGTHWSRGGGHKKDNKPYLCFAYGMYIGNTHFLISKLIANTYPNMLMAKATKHRYGDNLTDIKPPQGRK